MTERATRTKTRGRPTWLSDRDAPLVFQFGGAASYVPLVVTMGLFLFSWALLVLGPIDWQLVRPVRVHLFLTAATAATVGGYVLAVRRRRTPSTPAVRLTASSLVVAAAATYLALYLPVVHTTTGKWYPDVWGGLTDAGAAYAQNKERNETVAPTFLYVRMLVAPLTVLIFPLTLFLWPRLSTAARALGVACVVLSVALTIAQGINRGVAEFAGQMVLFLVLVAATSLSKSKRGRLIRSLVGIGIVVGLFFGYYATTMNSRISADATQSAEQAREEGTDDPVEESVDERMRDTALIDVATVRDDNPYFVLVPAGLQSEGLIFISYLTHGYRGLSLAMDEDFTPTWGLGFSEFFRHNLMRVVGQSAHEDDVEARTYPGKLIGRGWPDGMVWSTFFVHPASDISFPGTILLMVLIGYGLGASWRDTLERHDPLAAGVFFYLCILVFYLPANNQLFQGGELAIGFTVLTAAWLFLRRRGRVSPEEPGVGETTSG